VSSSERVLSERPATTSLAWTRPRPGGDGVQELAGIRVSRLEFQKVEILEEEEMRISSL